MHVAAPPSYGRTRIYILGRERNDVFTGDASNERTVAAGGWHARPDEADDRGLPGRRFDRDEIRFVQLSRDKIAAVLGGEF